jgi:hypothetical protein
MQRFGRRIDFDLQTYGRAGCECWICDEDGWCLYRAHWASLDEALADAEDQKRALARGGWTIDK